MYVESMDDIQGPRDNDVYKPYRMQETAFFRESIPDYLDRNDISVRLPTTH